MIIYCHKKRGKIKIFLKEKRRFKKIFSQKICAILFFLIIFAMFLLYTGSNPVNDSQAVQAQVQDSEQKDEEQRQRVTTTFQVDKNLTCLEQGKELFWEQKYSEAIKHLEECLQQDTENPEIYYYIGQSYFQQGQQAAQKRNILRATRYYRQAYQVSDTAIEKYLKLINQNHERDHTNDYLQLAYIYQIRSLIPGVNEYQEAIDIYQKLLTEKPYLTHVYYHIGWINFQQEDYQSAIEAFLKYLKPGIKSDFVYYHLGLSYDKIGERERAEYYYRLILEEFPGTEIAVLAKKELNE